MDAKSTYDHQGAIFYTVVTLIFYSLSLFCSLILNIDPDDHFHEKTWLIEEKKSSHSNQTDVLDTLSDQTLREKYWRIYYGSDTSHSRPNNFLSRELKRLSFVSKRKKALNFEQSKRLSRRQELEDLNPKQIYNSQQLLSEPSSRIKLRRARSTSVPGVLLPIYTSKNHFFKAHSQISQ